MVHSLQNYLMKMDIILEKLVVNTVQQQDVHVVGWFDSVVLRHSRRVSGITDLSINSIDVLTGLDTVKICTAYELDGEEITEYPANLDQLRRCKPIFEELPGWEEDITGCRTLEELPDNARKYLERISELCNVRISIFSVGPDRDQTNLLEQLW